MSSYRQMRFDPVETKLLILYILDCGKRPLTAIEITDIVLADSLLNFFETHMYITTLIADGQIIHHDDDTYSLTEDGRQAVSFFKKKVPYSIRERIAEQLNQKNQSLQQEALVFADYTPLSGQDFMVHLRLAEEAGSLLLDLQFRVTGHDMAKQLCQRWKENYSELYGELLQTFSK